LRSWRNWRLENWLSKFSVDESSTSFSIHEIWERDGIQYTKLSYFGIFHLFINLDWFLPIEAHWENSNWILVLKVALVQTIGLWPAGSADLIWT
jgi:hypothetical protein